MDFKKLTSILPFAVLGGLVAGTLLWKAMSVPAQAQSGIEPVIVPQQQFPAPVVDLGQDAVIQKQLDLDRQHQKETKEMKIKLEQTNLELEEEKAMVEINKLKKENADGFEEPTPGNQNNLPQVVIDYIGGAGQKEAILAINGTSYQVKEKSSPTDNIQVVSIADSSVTLHFTAPQDLTKTIDYRPQ